MRWLDTLRVALLASAIGHFGWEIAQLPLYTLWWTGTAADVAFAVLHCTLGDLVIATSSIVAALMVFGRGWPSEWTSFRNVMLAATILGLGYTVYSEWLNVTVRETWVYTAWMPRIPPLGTGLSPLLQWIVVPGLVFLIVWRRVSAVRPKDDSV